MTAYVRHSLWPDSLIKHSILIGAFNTEGKFNLSLITVVLFTCSYTIEKKCEAILINRGFPRGSSLPVTFRHCSSERDPRVL